VFEIVVRRPASRGLSAAALGVLADAERRLGRLWLLAALVLVGAQLAWAAAQAEAIAELPILQALDGPVARAVLLDSRFAALWWIRLGLGLLLTILLCFRPRFRRLGVGLGLLLIVATSLSGHASGARVLPPIAVGLDAIHLAAAAVWLGGLARLALLIRPITAAVPAIRHVLQVLVPRVSKLAVISVAALVVTGTFSAWEQAGGLDAVLVTAYGQALLGKLALVGFVLAIGAVNLLVMRPG
jgi:putative copper export protein